MIIIEYKQSLETIWLLVLDKNAWNPTTVNYLYMLNICA